MTVFTCHLKLYSIADNSLIFSFPAQFCIKHICMSELSIQYNGAWSLAHYGQMYTIQTTRSKEWVLKMNVSSSASLRTAYFHYVNRGIWEFRETLKQLIVSRFFKSTGRFAISLFLPACKHGGCFSTLLRSEGCRRPQRWLGLCGGGGQRRERSSSFSGIHRPRDWGSDQGS